jgi:hypothetical protein
VLATVMFKMANRDSDDGTQENANKYGEAHHGRSFSSVGRIIVPTTGADFATELSAPVTWSVLPRSTTVAVPIGSDCSPRISEG